MTKKPFQVILGGKPAAGKELWPVTANANAQIIEATRVAQHNAHAARATDHAARVRKAILSRKLASKVRTLMYEIENALNLDASKLRAYALHLENMAERWSGQ